MKWMKWHVVEDFFPPNLKVPQVQHPARLERPPLHLSHQYNIGGIPWGMHKTYCQYVRLKSSVSARVNDRPFLWLQDEIPSLPRVLAIERGPCGTGRSMKSRELLL
jgi:hypothetical protein